MDNHNACETAWLNGYKTGREAVEKKGPIDVAIVVRCKDCRYSDNNLTHIERNYYRQSCVMCTKIVFGERVAMLGEDFCSYGERRTECD